MALGSARRLCIRQRFLRIPDRGAGEGHRVGRGRCAWLGGNVMLGEIFHELAEGWKL